MRSMEAARHRHHHRHRHGQASGLVGRRTSLHVGCPKAGRTKTLDGFPRGFAGARRPPCPFPFAWPKSPHTAPQHQTPTGEATIAPQCSTLVYSLVNRHRQITNHPAPTSASNQEGRLSAVGSAAGSGQRAACLLLGPVPTRRACDLMDLFLLWSSSLSCTAYLDCEDKTKKERTSCHVTPLQIRLVNAAARH